MILTAESLHLHDFVARLVYFHHITEEWRDGSTSSGLHYCWVESGCEASLTALWFLLRLTPGNRQSSSSPEMAMNPGRYQRFRNTKGAVSCFNNFAPCSSWSYTFCCFYFYIPLAQCDELVGFQRWWWTLNFRWHHDLVFHHFEWLSTFLFHCWIRWFQNGFSDDGLRSTNALSMHYKYHQLYLFQGHAL